MDYFNKSRYFNGAGTVIGIITLVWWCALYPELCFPRDTYEAVYESRESQVQVNEGVGTMEEPQGNRSKEDAGTMEEPQGNRDKEDVGTMEEPQGNRGKEDAGTMEELREIEEGYPGILSAEDEDIVIGSRFLEWLEEKLK